MEEKVIQSIPATPLALMTGAVGAAIGLLIGIFYALTFGAIMSAYPTSGVLGVPGWFGIIFGVGAIITMPIFGFIGGLIEGGLVAILYNFFAPRIGGVKIRVKDEVPAPPQ